MGWKRVIQSVSVLWLSSLIAAILSFLIQALLARKLTPQVYGMFTASLATVTLFSSLASFGLRGFWLKVFGEEGWQAKRWLPASWRYLASSTSATFFLLFLWAFWGPHDLHTTYILSILSLHILGLMIAGLVSAKFQLEERFTSLALLQLVPHLIRFSLIALISFLLVDWMTVLSVSTVYAMVAVLLIFIGGLEIIKMQKGEINLIGHECGSQDNNVALSACIGSLDVAKRSWPFGLGGLFYVIYYQTDIILLKYLASDSAAGIYNVAFTVMAAVYLLPSVVYQKFLLPKYHRWAYQDKHRFYHAYRRGNKIMLICGTVAMIVLWVVIPSVIPVFFGSNYQDSIILVLLLAVCAPIKFVSSGAGAVLTTNVYIRKKIIIMGAGAIFNVMFNFIFIPIWGYFGAVLSTIATEVIVLVSFLYFIKTTVFQDEPNSLGQD